MYYTVITYIWNNPTQESGFGNVSHDSPGNNGCHQYALQCHTSPASESDAGFCGFPRKHKYTPYYPQTAPPNYSGTVTGQVIPVGTIFTVHVGLWCVTIDGFRSMQVHCLYLNADCAHQDCINLLVSGGGVGPCFIFTS